MDTNRTKPAGNRRVTIKDVAAALNVAVSTVSNAYNRPDQLSPALRQRVFETAERIGYPGPNPVARGLRRGTSGLIAIFLGQPLAAAYRRSGHRRHARGHHRCADRVRSLRTGPRAVRTGWRLAGR